MHRSLLLLAATLLAGPAAAESLSALDRDLTWQAMDAAQLQPRVAELELAAKSPLHWEGGHFVHLDQKLAGLPVLGGRLVADFDSEGRLRRLKGTPLNQAPLSMVPSQGAEQATARAEAFVADEHGTGRLWAPRASQAIHRNTDGLATLVWAVDVSAREPVGAWQVLIDAHDGRIVSSEPTLHTAFGTIYPTNPESSELVEVELPGVTGNVLRNDYAYVNSCSNFDEATWVCHEVESQATADGGGDFHYDPDAFGIADPFAEVQMFWHLDRVAHFFEDEFGFRTNFGVEGRAVQGIVNFPLANAFYGDADGDGLPEVAFGQGNFVAFSYDSDVVYHEFGHAVFGTIVDGGSERYDEIGRLPSSSGLNEGTADLFSMVLNEDPHLGEYAGGAGSIRELDDDRHCPTDIYGESHRDGEIWGAFGWNLISDELIGPIPTAHLFFGAIAAWDEEVSWQTASQTILESASALQESGFLSTEQADRIALHAEEAGMDDCGRIVRMDEGARPTQIITSRVRNDGSVSAGPLYTQFSLDAPEGAVSLSLSVDSLVGQAPPGYTVYVRRGEPVFHELVEVDTPFGPRTRPQVADYDFEVSGQGVGTVIEMDATTDPPLEPGATVYFAIWSAAAEGAEPGRYGAEITLAGEVDIVPVEEAPIADDDDGLAGAGCSDCAASVAAGPSAGGLAFALLGLLGLRRRR